MKANLFLDDYRSCPEGYILVRDYEECIILLENGVFERVSLDYDLGYGQKTGYDVLVWLREHPEHLPKKIRVHSSHPAGSRMMLRFIKENLPQVELYYSIR